MLNKFELTSQDKVYLLKLYDSKKIPSSISMSLLMI